MLIRRAVVPSARPALGLQLQVDEPLTSSQRLLGRIAAAGGAHPVARRHLEDALRTFGVIPARLEIARTHAALSTLARAGGRAAEAEEHATSAARIFGELGIAS
jgi:hypothetical protein